MIAMRNAGAIARNENIGQFRQTCTDILALRAHGKTGLGHFRLADLEALPMDLPEVAKVAPFFVGEGQRAA